LLNKSVTTGYDNDGNLIKKTYPLHDEGTLSLIFMQAYNAFLLVDKEMEDSTFIQLFVLENYNENYFIPISLTPWAKIYKVKKQERE
ncbi:MAG: peptide transporter, partial [Campylobacteraceae bacterium]|nr:peptide transporter [Campylobacteraceae bacterium]